MLKISFIFLCLLLLTGCLPGLWTAPGFYAGSADVIVKSKEFITKSECKWRCYEKKEK